MRMGQMYYKHPFSVRVFLRRRFFAASSNIATEKYPQITAMSSSRSWIKRSPIFLATLSFLFCFPSCSRTSNTIAVIPRACGTALWEPEHTGAAHVARRKGMNVYWNAPTREDDVAGQIDLLDRVVARGYAGIIIAPIITADMDHETVELTILPSPNYETAEDTAKAGSRKTA